MTNRTGYIALHRKILDDDLMGILTNEQFAWTIKLLLAVNWKEGIFFNRATRKKEIIGRGSMITSVENLSIAFKTSNSPAATRQKIRTFLKLLSDAHFVTIRTTNRYTKITIVNYNKYQDLPKQLTNQKTIEKPIPIHQDNHYINKDLNNKQNTPADALIEEYKLKAPVRTRTKGIVIKARDIFEVLLSAKYSQAQITAGIRAADPEALPWEIEKEVRREKAHPIRPPKPTQILPLGQYWQWNGTGWYILRVNLGIKKL